MIFISANIKINHNSRPVAAFCSNTLQKNSLLVQTEQVNNSEYPPCQDSFEKFMLFFVKRMQNSKYSKNPKVRLIEEEYSKKGTNIRFNNNLKLAKFTKEGLQQVELSGYTLPENILFVNPLLGFFTNGMATRFRNPQTNIAPILIPSNITNMRKKFNKKYNAGIISTNSEHHMLLHEIGHWKHFQEMPSIQKCTEIWKQVDNNLIANTVSLRAVSYADGTEFSAEVYAGLINGKKYSPYIMSIYKQLHSKSNII